MTYRADQLLAHFALITLALSAMLDSQLGPLDSKPASQNNLEAV